MNTAVMFSRESDEWTTPRETFDALNAEFGFDVDAAATADNTLVEGAYFGPDHPYQANAVGMQWHPYGRTFWLNPPYSLCREFIGKAAEQRLKGCTTVCLVPSRTDTRWWHENVWDVQTHSARPGVEIRFIKGRLKFGGTSSIGAKANSAPFPSVVVIFRGSL